MRLVIVDYGMGNLRSVQKAFQRVGAEAEISSFPDAIRAADRLVLPGVGHFAQGMENLRARGLVAALEARVSGVRVPLLGICLGLQLLTRRSEEGGADGLGWIDAECIRLDVSPGGPFRVPHFGWNSISVTAANPLVPRETDGTSFYFAHSYHAARCAPDTVLASTSYGVEFASVLCKDNVYATQFHPEKSHRRGLALLQRFMEIA